MDNIIIINDFCSVNGGAAAVAIESALGLAGAGHRVGFAGMVGPIDQRLQNHPNITVWCAQAQTFLDANSKAKAAIDGWWNKPAQVFLADCLKGYEASATLVHVHGWVKAFSPSIFATLRVRGFKVVVTLHDYFLACPNGGFLAYQKAEICHRRALSISCLACNCDPRSYPQKLWRFGRGMIQTYGLKLGESVDGFIGVSQFSVEKLRPYIGAEIPVQVVRNPVSVVRPANPGGDPSGPLLFVGRLSKEKGAGLAAEAARRLGRSIIFVGAGDEMASLRMNYPEAIFEGWQPPARVAELMGKASCLVFPSLWYETNGMVVLEAMAQGLPVVVASDTAPTEFVKDGVNGRVFKIGDVDSLTTTLAAVLGGDGSIVGPGAYDWYWQNPWTIEQHVTGLIGFYESIMSRRIRA